MNVLNPKVIQKISTYSFLAAVFILPFAKAGFEIFFGLTLFFWILSKTIERGSLCAERVLFIALGLFVISSSVSAFGSGYPEISFRGMIKLIKYVLIMFVSADLFVNASSLKRLFTIGTFSLGLVILDSLIQNIFGQDLILSYPVQYANDQIRLTGPYQSYGLLATHLIAFLPILTAFTISSKYLKQLGWGVLFLVSFYVLCRTQSRGAWLAVFVSLLIYSLMTRNKWFLIVLAISVLTMPFILPKKTLFHLDTFNQEASLIERNLLWNRAISVIKARPWFGCGINTYTKNYPKYAQGKEWDLMKQEAMRGQYAHFGNKEAWRIPGHPDQIPGHYVHNGYLQIAAETGLVSLALFFMIIGFSFISGFQAFKKAGKDKKPIIAGLICGLVALLLQAIVDTTLQGLQSATLVWLFLGLLIGLKNAVVSDQK